MKMKAVAFVCLLSLSMCISQPAAPDTNATQPSAPPASQIEKGSQPALPANSDGKNQTATPTGTEKAVTHKEEVSVVTIPSQGTEKPNVPPQATATPATSNQTSTIKTVDNNTKDSKANETKVPGQPKNETKIDSDPAANDSKTDKDVKPEASTEKAAEAKTTEVPKAATEVPPVVQARGFDGPSFIGGIILTLGLLAIGFMGFKYYKNQTERNYHTL